MDTETLEQTRQVLRRFVRERLVPLEQQVADDDRIPDEIRGEFAGMGLFGLAIPEAYGGLGLALPAGVELGFGVGWASPAEGTRGREGTGVSVRLTIGGP